jgi:glycosyltransferase involved in cell wall biosynthesis
MLFIINDSPIIRNEKRYDSGGGGTASFISDFLNYLDSEKKPFGLIGNYLDTAKHPYNTYITGITSNIVFTIRLFFHFLLRWYSRNDVLYFHRPDHLGVALFVRGKKILHLHGQLDEIIRKSRSWYIKAVFSLLERIAFRKADGIVATDSETIARYSKKYAFIRDKITRLPTGIDSTFFMPEDRMQVLHLKKLNPSKTYLLYTGRLTYPKRVAEIIRAVQLTVVKNENIVLLIAGDGKDRPLLDSIVSDLDLEKHVIFLGNISRQELKDYINVSSAGILLSWSEGSPISVKECLACGIPVLVNDVGDLRDYILPDQTGYIIDPVTEQNIADHIILILQNSARMRNECIRVSGNFSATKIFSRLINMLHENTGRIDSPENNLNL